MGISGLFQFVKDSIQPGEISQFRGCTVAVDTSCWLHRGVFSCVEDIALGKETRAYVQYCLKFIRLLLSCDIHVILVFDGQPLPAKAATNDARKERREANREIGLKYLAEGNVVEARKALIKTTQVTAEIKQDLIRAVRSQRGVDILVAPYEADAQLTYLQTAGIAQLIITEDTDLIPFGCHTIMFKMDELGHGSVYRSENLYKSMVNSAEKFDFQKFRRTCILSGCDYLPEGLPGVGLKKARTFFSKVSDLNLNRCLPRIPNYLNMRKLVVTRKFIEEFVAAERTFLYQLIFDPLTGAVGPLTPYPKDSDINAAAMPYAGKMIDNDGLARQICLGNMNARTHEKLDSFRPKKEESHSWSIWNPHFRSNAQTFRLVSPKKGEKDLFSSAGGRRHYHQKRSHSTAFPPSASMEKNLDQTEAKVENQQSFESVAIRPKTQPSPTTVTMSSQSQPPSLNRSRTSQIDDRSPREGIRSRPVRRRSPRKILSKTATDPSRRQSVSVDNELMAIYGLPPSSSSASATPPPALSTSSAAAFNCSYSSQEDEGEKEGMENDIDRNDEKESVEQEDSFSSSPLLSEDTNVVTVSRYFKQEKVEIRATPSVLNPFRKPQIVISKSQPENSVEAVATMKTESKSQPTVSSTEQISTSYHLNENPQASTISCSIQPKTTPEKKINGDEDDEEEEGLSDCDEISPPSRPLSTNPPRNQSSQSPLLDSSSSAATEKRRQESGGHRRVLSFYRGRPKNPFFRQSSSSPSTNSQPLHTNSEESSVSINHGDVFDTKSSSPKPFNDPRRPGLVTTTVTISTATRQVDVDDNINNDDDYSTAESYGKITTDKDDQPICQQTLSSNRGSSSLYQGNGTQVVAAKSAEITPQQRIIDRLSVFSSQTQNRDGMIGLGLLQDDDSLDDEEDDQGKNSLSSPISIRTKASGTILSKIISSSKRKQAEGSSLKKPTSPRKRFTSPRKKSTSPLKRSTSPSTTEVVEDKFAQFRYISGNDRRRKSTNC